MEGRDVYGDLAAFDREFLPRALIDELDEVGAGLAAAEAEDLRTGRADPLERLRVGGGSF